jgi:hypothetical protein
MSEQSDPPSITRKVDGRGSDRGPPGYAVLIVLILVALACGAGYVLLMKLINISRDEDCLLAHRRDCGAIELPSGR